jgi:hypothetical protein
LAVAEDDPFWRLWQRLIERVLNPSVGFEALSEPERIVIAVRVLEDEVNNGGFHQYFFNSSADYFGYAVRGLKEMQAERVLSLLLRSKEILFPSTEVPLVLKTRRQKIPAPRQTRNALDELERSFYTDPDGLEARMRNFAREHGLYRE